jgi:DNA-binding XRE family transcriptional regulator
MSAHMKTHPIEGHEKILCMQSEGILYQFPIEVAEKYRVTEGSVSVDAVFAKVNKKYTRPGALLKGLRIRENLTQVQMAEKIEVTQSDISQMEKGTRRIGRVIAKRIATLFDVDYQPFLS